MVSYDFSGEEVAKAMLNSSVGWYPARTVGDHWILKWEPPDTHENTEPRTVSVPLWDSIPRNTLDKIADDAGAESLESFCEWIDSNT